MVSWKHGAIYFSNVKEGTLTKALEYYEKHAELLTKDPEKAAVAICKEFTDEIAQICKARNAKTDEALYSILRELNQKWNSLSRIVKDKQGFSPIRQDGLKRFWEINVPELVGHI